MIKVHVFEADGRSGGLAIFGMDEVVLSRKAKDAHHVDCWVKEEGETLWRLTGIYGWPEGSQKFRTLDLINSLGKDHRGPWIIGGDFNEVLKESEKQGGAVCDFNSVSAFRDCLDGSELRSQGVPRS